MMEKKVAIVTGGSGAGAGGASGRYISEKLASLGYAVALLDIKDQEGELVAKNIRAGGEEAKYYHCDICKESEVKEVVRQILSDYGRVDALVNNAFWHASEQPPLHELSLEEWDKHININLRGHFIVCRETIPHLLKQKSSNIVNISSTGCRRGEKGYAPYSAAKAGLEALTRSIAAEYGRKGLRCNCIVPGLIIDEPVQKEFDKIEVVKRSFDRIDRQILIPGRHPDGKGVAEAVAFLISDAMSYMTGEFLVLDGGALSHSPNWADSLAEEP